MSLTSHSCKHYMSERPTENFHYITNIHMHKMDRCIKSESRQTCMSATSLVVEETYNRNVFTVPFYILIDV